MVCSQLRSRTHWHTFPWYSSGGGTGLDLSAAGQLITQKQLMVCPLVSTGASPDYFGNCLKMLQEEAKVIT